MAYTTIDDPSAHFQTVTYTGGGNGSSVTFGGNSNLQLDWLWVKRRDSADSSKVFDTSRGIGSGSEPYLSTNSEEEEQTYAYLTSVNSDGFTWDTTDNSTGASSNTYVAWAWKANGGSTTTNDASATSVGTIDSVYQANTTAGFSIVTYTGTGSAGTIAHGLGAVPSWIIIKARTEPTGGVHFGSDQGNWVVYHQGTASDPETDLLLLNSTAAAVDSTGHMNDTAPTSSVFTINTNVDVNESSDTYVAYCFAEKQGYSKFGSYTGNGNADGPFLYLGFKPAWVMVKRTNTTGAWEIYDSARNGNDSNPINDRLRANDNAAENADDTSDYVSDFLSNGWKIRTNSGNWNTSGHTYIYMAFAEHPFVSSEGVPTTAR